MPLDVGSGSRLAWISKVMQHDEAVRSRVTKIFLGAKDAVLRFVVVGQLDERVESCHAVADRLLNYVNERASADSFLPWSAPQLVGMEFFMSKTLWRSGICLWPPAIRRRPVFA